MTISTYAELQTAIADTLNRDDLTSVIPNFIQLAESDLARQARHWRGEKRSVATISTQYVPIPADYLETIRLQVTSGTTAPLEIISQAELLDRKAANLNTSGSPAYYAFVAGRFELFPAPDGEYTVEIYYHAKAPALSGSNASNFMLTYFPDAYLYGALAHSAPYLKDDARLNVWSTLYANAISGINTSSEAAKYGGSGRRLKLRAY